MHYASRTAALVTDDQEVRLRRKRDVRVVEDRGGVTVYPEPYDAPVLPPGWAPLDVEDELSVLRACDAYPQSCRLRLGSVWDSSAEYRVYCLEADGWKGVCVATLYLAAAEDADDETSRGRNTRLLAIAHSADDAAHIAIEFINWDLEADGSAWRIKLANP